MAGKEETMKIIISLEDKTSRGVGKLNTGFRQLDTSTRKLAQTSLQLATSLLAVGAGLRKERDVLLENIRTLKSRRNVLLASTKLSKAQREELKKYNNELKLNNLALGINNTELDKHKRKLAEISTSLQKNEGALKKNTSAIKRNGASLKSLTINLSKLGSDLRTAGTNLNEIATPITQITKAAVGLATGIASVGAAMTAFSVKSAADFEQALQNINTLLVGVQTEDLPIIEQTILTLSQEIPQAATVLANAFYQIQSATNLGARGLGLLNIAARGAIAGFTDTKTAADGLVTVLNSYNLTTSEATRIMDVLFATVVKGKLTFEDLAKNIGSVSAIAKLSNTSLEELGALIAGLTKGTGQVEKSFTSLRAGMVSVIKPTQQQVDAFKRQGIQIRTVEGAVTSFADVLRQVAERQLNIAELAELFPKIRAIRGLSALVANFDLFEQSLALTEKSVGTFSVAFEKAMTTLISKFGVFRENVVKVAIDLGNSLNPIMKEVVVTATKLVQEFDRAINTGGKLGDQLKTAVEPAFNSLIDTLNVLAANLPDILGDLDFTGLKKAIQDLTGILSVDLSTKEGITAAFQKIIDSAKGLTNFVNGVVSALKTLIGFVGDAVESFNNLDESTQKIVGSLGLAATAFTLFGTQAINAVSALLGLMGQLRRLINVLAKKELFVALFAGSVPAVLGVGAITAALATLILSLSDTRKEIDVTIDKFKDLEDAFSVEGKSLAQQQAFKALQTALGLSEKTAIDTFERFGVSAERILASVGKTAVQEFGNEIDAISNEYTKLIRTVRSGKLTEAMLAGIKGRSLAEVVEEEVVKLEKQRDVALEKTADVFAKRILDGLGGTKLGETFKIVLDQIKLEKEIFPGLDKSIKNAMTLGFSESLKSLEDLLAKFGASARAKDAIETAIKQLFRDATELADKEATALIEVRRSLAAIGGKEALTVSEKQAKIIDEFIVGTDKLVVLEGKLLGLREKLNRPGLSGEARTKFIAERNTLIKEELNLTAQLEDAAKAISGIIGDPRRILTKEDLALIEELESTTQNIAFTNEELLDLAAERVISEKETKKEVKAAAEEYLKIRNLKKEIGDLDTSTLAGLDATLDALVNLSDEYRGNAEAISLINKIILDVLDKSEELNKKAGETRVKREDALQKQVENIRFGTFLTKQADLQRKLKKLEDDGLGATREAALVRELIELNSNDKILKSRKKLFEDIKKLQLDASRELLATGFAEGGDFRRATTEVRRIEAEFEALLLKITEDPAKVTDAELTRRISEAQALKDTLVKIIQESGFDRDVQLALESIDEFINRAIPEGVQRAAEAVPGAREFFQDKTILTKQGIEDGETYGEALFATIESLKPSQQLLGTISNVLNSADLIQSLDGYITSLSAATEDALIKAFKSAFGKKWEAEVGTTVTIDQSISDIVSGDLYVP